MKEDSLEKTENKEEKKQSYLSGLLDRINFGVTIWLSIYIIYSFNDYLPEVNWPWYLDYILLFIILATLIYDILDYLKSAMLIVIIVGAVIFSISMFYNTEEVSSDNATIENTNTYNFDYSRPITEIRNIAIQNNEMKYQIDSLEMQLDSINQKLENLLRDTTH